MDIFSFFGQFFDGWQLLIGMIVLGAASLILVFGSKGKKDATENIFVRLVVVFLVMIGVYRILFTIVIVGEKQAMTVALIVGLIGTLWSMGAKGWATTIGGLILALLLIVTLSVNVELLPESSPVGGFITSVAKAGAGLITPVVEAGAGLLETIRSAIFPS